MTLVDMLHAKYLSVTFNCKLRLQTNRKIHTVSVINLFQFQLKSIKINEKTFSLFTHFLTINATTFLPFFWVKF